MNEGSPRKIGKAFKRRWHYLFLLLVLVVFALFNVPLPYYVMKPGSALPLDKLVTVEQGYHEQGRLMMTTVALIKANVPVLAYGWLSPKAEILSKHTVLGDVHNQNEYNHFQLEVMENSQENAVINAFRVVGKPVIKEPQGVIVMGIVPGMPAEGRLRLGDCITGLDGKKIKTSQDLIDALQKKRSGDVVAFDVERENEKVTVDMPLAALPKSKDNPNQKGSQIGIGISAMTKTALKTEPTVTFRTQNIGGPSAGLMFTLEIINQLTPTDLTGGHIIAGTGTVDEEGNVGQIGGIQYKVIGAYKQGAKIFLAPADIKPGDNNYALALQQVKRLQMDMQVVPVKTVKEAYEYLKGLPAPAHPVPGTLLHRQ